MDKIWFVDSDVVGLTVVTVVVTIFGYVKVGSTRIGSTVIGATEIILLVYLNG